jgi:L-lactate dehydrogenase complex protein LldG
MLREAHLLTMLCCFCWQALQKLYNLPSVEQQTTSKEKILKKVRQALIFKSKSKYANIDLESNIYVQPPADEFTALEGQFVICDNKFDFIDKLLTLTERRKYKNLFCWDELLQVQLKDAGIPFQGSREAVEKMQVGITACEALIARTGSVMVTSGKHSRMLSIFPPVHIVVAYTSQVVMDIKDGLQVLRNKYGKNPPSMVSFISGPARTGNIENTLVTGSHGPREVFVFLIDDAKHE